jgi:hypothetical protein
VSRLQATEESASASVACQRCDVPILFEEDDMEGRGNAAGSLWYGNVKSTQELAKNAFDAINNGVAFAP